MDDSRTPEQQRDVFRFAAIAGPARGLDLHKRLPEVMRDRGWPQDFDLVCVLTAAIGLTKIGAGRTLFRRPSAASGCDGRWPVDAGRLEARQIVNEFELGDLLQGR